MGRSSQPRTQSVLVTLPIQVVKPRATPDVAPTVVHPGTAKAPPRTPTEMSAMPTIAVVVRLVPEKGRERA